MFFSESKSDTLNSKKKEHFDHSDCKKGLDAGSSIGRKGITESTKRKLRESGEENRLLRT